VTRRWQRFLQREVSNAFHAGCRCAIPAGWIAVAPQDAGVRAARAFPEGNPQRNALEKNNTRL